MTRQQLETQFEREALPLVRKSAHAFSRRSGLPVDDLIQEGSIAAWKNLLKYDPSHGCKLSTYIVRRVMGAMQDFARGHGHPLGVRCRKSLGRGDGPGVLSFDQIGKGSDGSGNVDHDNKQFELADYRSHSIPCHESDTRLDFDKHLHGLSPQQAQAVRLVFLSGKSQVQVASWMHVSPGRVSQLLADSFEILRAKYPEGAVA